MLRIVVIRTIFVSLFILFVQRILAYDNDFDLADTRSLSLGNVYALNEKLINPASLSFQGKPQLGLSVLNQFEIKELSSYNLYCLIPNKFLDCGIKISKYGYSEYAVYTIISSFSKKILDRLSLGINIYYTSEILDMDELNFNSYKIEIGSYYRLNDEIQIALLLKNIYGNNLSEALSFHGGLKYKVNSFSFVFESNYVRKDNIGFKLGIEYELIDKLFVRAGIHTKPEMPGLGIGYSIGSFTINYTNLIHQQLGNTNSIEIIYQF